MRCQPIIATTVQPLYLPVRLYESIACLSTVQDAYESMEHCFLEERGWGGGENVTIWDLAIQVDTWMLRPGGSSLAEAIDFLLDFGIRMLNANANATHGQG